MILIVDDEPADLESMRETLASAGYTAITATNGRDALAVYQQYHEQITLLLSDVAMEPIDGCELARRLTKVNKELAVIFVSAYAGAQALHYKIQASAAFLQKPFTREELLAKVREFIQPYRVSGASSGPSVSSRK
jgi:CheY-like chemotaxis protein